MNVKFNSSSLTHIHIVKRLNSQSTTGNPVIKAMVYDGSKATVYYGGKGGKIFVYIYYINILNNSYGMVQAFLNQ